MARSRTALTLGSGPDALVLKVSGDAYQGAAQYTIKVDGQQVGGTLTATAANGSGLADTITVLGDWGPGAHRVEVTFLNDLYAPNAGDRNLFLEGATYNGQAVAGARLELFSNGTKAFSFTEAAPAPAPAPEPVPEPEPAPAPAAELTLGSGPDTLVLKVSGDAYQGAAQYTIKVDGQQVGGTLTATAANGSGLADTITVLGDWGPGAHRVEVTFLNDLYAPNAGDRNLFLEGATYNGQAVAGARLELFSNGTKAFSFTEAAPAPAPEPVPEPAPAPAQGGSRQFFSDDSPWNTQVSTSARFSEVPGLDALMDQHAVGLSAWDAAWPSVAIYYATANDPVEEVRWIADSWSPVNGGGVARVGNGASVDASLRAQSKDINPFLMNPYSTQVADLAWNNGGALDVADYDEWVQSAVLRVHVPADAVPASDGDGLMVVIQPDGRALELYSPIKLGDGTLVSMMYSFTDAESGLGVGAENGRRASMVPIYAGAITDEDIAAGRIDHALAVNVPASMLAEGFTGPALAIDSNDGYSGTLPMGSRLAIPAGIDIAALGLQTQIGRMMAEAVQDYGVFVVDRGGGGITVATEYAPNSGMLSGYSWPVQQDLEAIFRAAQLVQPDQVVWV